MNKVECIAETRKFIHGLANVIMVALGNHEVLTMSLDNDTQRDRAEKVQKNLNRIVEMMKEHREFLIKEQENP